MVLLQQPGWYLRAYTAKSKQPNQTISETKDEFKDRIVSQPTNWQQCGTDGGTDEIADENKRKRIQS